MDVSEEPRWWTERFGSSSVSAAFARLARERESPPVVASESATIPEELPDNVSPISQHAALMRKYRVR